MKVIELDIHNIRGISHLSIKPDGRNFAIWGPNGTGKSAVVDAIDFLLTGRVSRLTGKGTGGITLSKYGPHIDHKPMDAQVRAVVQLPGIAKPVELKRCMAHPNTLEYEKSIEPYIKPIMTLAQRGQYVLTRREILKYITSEAATRAQEIQDLLNITEIEDIRKSLVKAQNDLDKELQVAKRHVDTAKGAINATIQQKVFREDIVLQIINQNRAILGGQPISNPCSKNLKIDLRPPTVASINQFVNIALLEKDIQNLTEMALEKNGTQIIRNERELRRLIETIQSDPQLLHALAHIDLIKMGIRLIDETGQCPLCGASWPSGQLQGYLEKQLSVAEIAEKYREQVIKLSAVINSFVNTTIASLQKVIEVTQFVDLKDDLVSLQGWLGNLQCLSNALSTPIEKYLSLPFSSDQIQKMLAPPNFSQILTHVHTTIKNSYPETTPEQTAWDTLTRLEENIRAIENAQESLRNAELFYQRAHTLLTSFQEARNAILGDLYKNIRDQFVSLYRQLHGNDEDKFMAKIEPDGAGLNFEVDFYGRGTHPPQALHSEGHQDSMGLCLYLTLAERLNQGLINLIILDDVVMSVDAEHRRQLCNLLGKFFPERQFLITTHDRTWVNQLKSEGVVSPQQTWEFRNWSIENGPEIYYVADIMWDRIENALREQNVPSAAAQLRRGAEEFFGMICDALRVPIIYKLSGQWELGELFLPAMEQYRDLVKKAQKAAKSWGNSEEAFRLQEIESIRSEIYKRTFAEQWAVNPNVHYNNWIDFSEKDFRPVVEAFHDLFNLFVCSQCGGMLHIAMVDKKPACVRCNCGKVNWNLEENK